MPVRMIIKSERERNLRAAWLAKEIAETLRVLLLQDDADLRRYLTSLVRENRALAAAPIGRVFKYAA
jgi:hypothetical protein